MITLDTNIPENEIVDKTERIINSCKTPGQMKTAYNFIERLQITGTVCERYLTYLYILFEKKASEMESI